jgi:hypothetical protein
MGRGAQPYEPGVRTQPDRGPQLVERCLHDREPELLEPGEHDADLRIRDLIALGRPVRPVLERLPDDDIGSPRPQQGLQARQGGRRIDPGEPVTYHPHIGLMRRQPGDVRSHGVPNRRGRIGEGCMSEAGPLHGCRERRRVRKR